MVFVSFQTNKLLFSFFVCAIIINFIKIFWKSVTVFCPIFFNANYVYVTGQSDTVIMIQVFAVQLEVILYFMETPLFLLRFGFFFFLSYSYLSSNKEYVILPFFLLSSTTLEFKIIKEIKN